MNSAMQPTYRHLPRPVLLFLLPALWLAPELVAAKGEKAELRKANRDPGADMATIKAGRREENAGAKSSRASAGEAEARQLSRLRERLDVTDDDEWAVIAERIGKVEELRRTLASGGKGAPGFAAAGDKAGRNARPGASAHPEFDALRAALGDQYPDAEIKARLARAHEVFQQNEAQLRKAQADLRSVLSIRQEAIVVMAGLLPP